MLKKFAALFCALSVAFAFTSCEEQGTVEKTKLSKPNLEPGEKTETSFTITWNAVTNADSYIYTFDGGAEKTTTETSVTFEGLTIGVEYTVAVKAHSDDANKFEDSDFSTIYITLQKQAPADPWVGTWTVTAEMGLGWEVTEEGYLSTVMVEGPINRTITIVDMSEEAGQEGVYYVSGLSELGADIPTLAMYDATNDGLIIYTGVAVGQESDGYTPTWATIVSIVTAAGEEDVDWLFEEGYPSFLLAFNEGSTTEAMAYANENQLEDGSVLTSFGMDVYGLNAAGDDWVIYMLDQAGNLPTTLLGSTTQWSKKDTKANLAIVSDWNFVPRFGQMKANL